MTRRIYQRAYEATLNLREENPRITSTGIIRALKEMGFTPEEIPVPNTIQSYCRGAGIQLSLSIDPQIKRTAKALYVSGKTIAQVEKECNEMYNESISNMTYRRWIFGEKYGRRMKKVKKGNIWRQCGDAINSGEICFGEAIDWLVERGESEDAAFEWAMNRFYGGNQSVSGSASDLPAMTLIKRRSKLPKAA